MAVFLYESLLLSRLSGSQIESRCRKIWRRITWEVLGWYLTRVYPNVSGLAAWSENLKW